MLMFSVINSVYMQAIDLAMEKSYLVLNLAVFIV